MDDKSTSALKSLSLTAIDISTQPLCEHSQPGSTRNLHSERQVNSEPPFNLPYDLIDPILSFLTDRADWHACCLVSRSFNQVSTPLLYRTLDSRIIKLDGRNSRGDSLDSRVDGSPRPRVNNNNSDSNRTDSNSNIILYHPATTLLSNPHLAKHVRHVTETGAVHRIKAFSNAKYSSISDDALNALALCRNLLSFTWIDDTMYGPGMGAFGGRGGLGMGTNDRGRERETNMQVIPGTFLMRFIDLVRGRQGNGPSHSGFPLRHLTLRTHSDLGSTIWDSLGSLSGLTRISIWSMDGPPRVLQGGWSKVLGSTLEELELGRCAGVPPTILETVISHLPRLRSLRLKGVPSSNILIFLTYLPNLESLDVEYLPSQTRLPARDVARLEMSVMPSLKTLTVRTNSRAEGIKMYDWIRQLVKREGLEAFKLHAFSFSLPMSPSSSTARSYSSSSRSSPASPDRYSPHAFASLPSTKSMQYTYVPSADSFRNTLSFRDLGETLIPRAFILDLARIHSSSLKRFEAAEAGVMMMGDVECVCVSFPMLEVLECAVGVEGVPAIHHAIRSARNLRTLKLNIQWFTLADARSLMLRSEDSVLRTIGVGGVLYTGKWALSAQSSSSSNESQLEFVVVSNVEDQ
ncbi:hypothetical protein GYMLUDRAFT_199954 [Collybiopsis luxurians FD-317 M1]|uniref:F-box domain-containing protein n=1 Tax=Collybiopsis luxurians FD-317 M1 TaxID=944289 RepID=A0A0D0CXZ5_9AGAR|nr:hypothetical protein GYMLUDRAFT_199954 [Collybiopsis luxurians FD-317 M1]